MEQVLDVKTDAIVVFPTLYSYCFGVLLHVVFCVLCGVLLQVVLCCCELCAGCQMRRDNTYASPPKIAVLKSIMRRALGLGGACCDMPFHNQLNSPPPVAVFFFSSSSSLFFFLLLGYPCLLVSSTNCFHDLSTPSCFWCVQCINNSSRTLPSMRPTSSTFTRLVLILVVRFIHQQTKLAHWGGGGYEEYNGIPSLGSEHDGNVFPEWFIPSTGCPSLVHTTCCLQVSNPPHKRQHMLYIYHI